jgi:DNA recombination protein RmuC
MGALMMSLMLTISMLGLSLLTLLSVFLLRRQYHLTLDGYSHQLVAALTSEVQALNQQLETTLQLQSQANLLQIQTITTEVIQVQMKDVREQMNHSFQQHALSLTTHLQTLSDQVRQHLQQLTQQVNQQLHQGFEKSSSTFSDIIKRLAVIDEAQKKITELSSHVVSLQDVLVDRKARGAFGEVQLSNLIANMIPATHYRMQYTLSNQKRADCMLFLPQPTGNIVIDAKFPLETYQKMQQLDPGSHERKQLQQQFRVDIQKHIKDIAEKYIVPEETADGAILFIPAESIFAEIHANYPDLITMSQRLKVWLVSPSTLMAVLTTARAVLKDDATRKQVHIIQQHLHALSQDFDRFEKRMDKLSKHMDLAHQDVAEVNTSAKKITRHFQRIESVELGPIAVEPVKVEELE